MLLFSLALRPLTRPISQSCNVLMNRWYADDGTIIGRIDEVVKALEIIKKEGPKYRFYLNPAKTRVFWPKQRSDNLQSLTAVDSLHVIEEGRVDLLGAPIENELYMAQYLKEKPKKCNTALSHLHCIPEARTRFHLHHVSGSACRMQHLFRLVPPEFYLPFAQQFDKDQLDMYAHFNNVLLPPSTTAQIRLPFIHRGHGLPSLASTLHASYGASLIDCARFASKDHNSRQ